MFYFPIDFTYADRCEKTLLAKLASGFDHIVALSYLLGKVPLDLPLLLLLLQVVSSWTERSEVNMTRHTRRGWCFSPKVNSRFNMFLCSSSSAVGL